MAKDKRIQKFLSPGLDNSYVTLIISEHTGHLAIHDGESTVHFGCDPDSYFYPAAMIEKPEKWRLQAQKRAQREFEALATLHRALSDFFVLFDRAEEKVIARHMKDEKEAQERERRMKEAQYSIFNDAPSATEYLNVPTPKAKKSPAKPKLGGAKVAKEIVT